MCQTAKTYQLRVLFHGNFQSLRSVTVACRKPGHAAQDTEHARKRLEKLWSLRQKQGCQAFFHSLRFSSLNLYQIGIIPGERSETFEKPGSLKNSDVHTEFTRNDCPYALLGARFDSYLRNMMRLNPGIDR